MSVYPPLRTWRSFLCWATFVLACSTAPVLAAPRNVAFDAALRAATERAPMLTARQAQTDAARAEASRAAALPDPRLIVGLANWPVTGADAFDMRADDMTTKQVGVMQEFPARAKRTARQGVADRAVDQALALSTSERLAVRQATAMAWIAAWTAQRELEALRVLREPTATAVRSAKARLAGGTGSTDEALATQAAVLELDNRIDAAQAQVEAAQFELARWLGEVEPVAAEGDPPVLARLPTAPSQLLESVDRQAPLLAWQAREAVAEAEVTSAIAEKRPDWSMEVSYGERERAPDGMPRSDMLMVEVAVGLPLFARNRQDRGVAARRAELQAVAAERDDARRAQLATVRRNLAEWQAAQRQLERLEREALPLAHDRAAVALAAYAGGGDLQNWLEARGAEIELQLEHARLLGELGRTWSALAYLLPDDKESQP
jgi:cobalt-zinc-cadmium efflux system outer membrane protein